jgi:hypothetical protein
MNAHPNTIRTGKYLLFMAWSSKKSRVVVETKSLRQRAC